MKFGYCAAWACLGILLLGSQAAADQDAPAIEAQESAAARQAYEQAMQAAEQEREKAMLTVEKARQELERSEALRSKASAETAQAAEQSREAAIQRRQEVQAMRQELSRVQEELRRASREVVRAHRELDHTRAAAPVADVLQFGSRAVIGVILGDSTKQGVQVLGVSPDGPAERAGIRQGDIIVAIMDKPLAEAESENASKVLLQVMESVKPGDELDITIQRDDGATEFVFPVTAEEREPVGWTSLIRLPSAPGAPDSPLLIEERIVVPQIDEEALEKKMEQLQEELEKRRIFVTKSVQDGVHPAPETWEFQFENLSELGEEAVHGANVWFGMSMTRGLKFAAVNEQLGDYFKTDYGVLVLNAEENNELQLQTGDVLLSVGGNRVETPSDVMRELRRVESGSTVQIELMRKRKNKTLDVIVPEHTRELGFVPESDHSYHYQIEVATD